MLCHRAPAFPLPDRAAGRVRASGSAAGTASSAARGHDPRADRGGKGLGLERPERLVLPRLDVARRPVVQQHVAEDHRVGLRHGDRLPMAEGWPTIAPSSSSISSGGRGQRRACRHPAPWSGPGAANLGAATRPPTRRGRCSRWGYAASSAAARFGPAKHRADVGGVVPAGVEIGVFRDSERHVKRAPPPSARSSGRDPAACSVAPSASSWVSRARRPPRPRGQAPSGRSRTARRTSGSSSSVDQPFRLQRRHIEDHLADGDAAPLFASAWRTRHRAGCSAENRSRARWPRPPSFASAAF